MDQVALIALGSNQPSPAGSPVETIRAALTALAACDGVDLRAASPLFATPAFPAGAGPDYVNAAVRVATSLSPQALLALLHGIESDYARTRVVRWGARSLDLDLLAVGGMVLPSKLTWRQWHDLPPADQTGRTPDQLILPHPRLQDRAFVLVPLASVAPDWRHPVLGLSVAEMLARLPAEDVDAVTPL